MTQPISWENILFTLLRMQMPKPVEENWAPSITLWINKHALSMILCHFSFFSIVCKRWSVTQLWMIRWTVSLWANEPSFWCCHGLFTFCIDICFLQNRSFVIFYPNLSSVFSRKNVLLWPDMSQSEMKVTSSLFKCS